MAAGKIDELVSDAALSQLDALLAKIGVSTQAMIDATSAAAKFNNEIGNTKTLTDFTQASQQAVAAMQGVVTAGNQVTASQQAVAAATQNIVQAAAAQVTAQNSVAAATLASSASFQDAINKQIQLKQELKNTADSLKNLAQFSNLGGAAAKKVADETANLTAKQAQLKVALQQTNAQVNQLVRENLAAKGSYNEMSATLDRLRNQYKQLSTEQRNNAEVGGTMRTQIQQLDKDLKAQDEQLGVSTRNVGGYEQAIKNAISSYVPFGPQIVNASNALKEGSAVTEEGTSAIGKLGLTLGGFTVAAFVAGIASATYYLSQFRDTGQDTAQFLGGLQNQLGNLGRNIVDLVRGNDKGDHKNLFQDLFKGFGSSFNQGVDVTAQQQYIKNLNEVNDSQVQALQIQADEYRAQAKNVKLSVEEKDAALKNSLKIETDIINQQKDNAKQNIDGGLSLAQKGVKPLLPSQRTLLSATGPGGVNTAIQYANTLAQQGRITEAGYEALMQAYGRQTAAIGAATKKLIREENDEARVGLKEAKQINNEQLELAKAKLIGERDALKESLSDDSLTYSEKLKKLADYLIKAKQIVATEEKIANRKPGITSTGRALNAQNAANSNAGITLFGTQETNALGSKEVERVKREQEAALAAEKAGEARRIDEIKNAEDTKLVNQSLAASNRLIALNKEYDDGLITQRDYQDKAKELTRQATGEQLQIQLAALKQILAAQAAAVGLGFGKPEDLTRTNNAITGVQEKINVNAAGQNSDGTKSAKDRQEENFQDAQKVANDTIAIAQGVDDIQKQIDDARIERLQRQYDILERNATFEKAQVQAGVGTARDKAQKEKQIDADLNANKLKIQKESIAAKRKEAEFDKAISVARIIEGTAVAIVAALKDGPVIGEIEAVLIGALGAVELTKVLAAPLPQYAKGVKKSPEGHAIVGERGIEGRIEPTGQFSLTPSVPTLTYLQKGTEIIPHHELIKLMAKPDPVQYVGGQKITWDEVVAAQKETTKAILSQRQQRRPGITKSLSPAYKQRNGLSN